MPTILAVMKSSVAGMSVPRAFRATDSVEYTNRSFVEYCGGVGVRRELTRPTSPRRIMCDERPIENDQGWTRGTPGVHNLV